MSMQGIKDVSACQNTILKHSIPPMQFFQSFIALCLMRADSLVQIYGTRSQIYKISIYRPKNEFNVGNPQGELPSINQI